MAVQNTSREPHELIFEDLSLFKTICKALFSNCFRLPCHPDHLNLVHSLKFPTFQNWFNLWDKSEVAGSLLEDEKSECYNDWLKKKKRNEKRSSWMQATQYANSFNSMLLPNRLPRGWITVYGRAIISSLNDYNDASSPRKWFYGRIRTCVCLGRRNCR